MISPVAIAPKISKVIKPIIPHKAMSPLFVIAEIPGIAIKKAAPKM